MSLRFLAVPNKNTNHHSKLYSFVKCISTRQTGYFSFMALHMRHYSTMLELKSYYE